MKKLSVNGWLARSRKEFVVDSIRRNAALVDFNAVIEAVGRIKVLDWTAAVALLHMVYGWMPTMLRTIEPHTKKQADHLLLCLRKVRKGEMLSFDELEVVRHFSNKSIVGASKVLHALNPSLYAIWDSRVAKVFMWKTVTRGTFAKTERYFEYTKEISMWALDKRVVARCRALRKLNKELRDASDIRLIELVMFVK